MIQLNLLPSVKLEYVQAQKAKRITSTLAILISIASIVILTLLFAFDLYQKNVIHSNKNSINKLASTLTHEKDINKILTLQNQLHNLSSLHEKKPLAQNVFTYLYQLTPANANITTLNVDFAKNTLSINGNADNIATVNQFIDTIKLTTYNQFNNAKSAKSAFSTVVLTSFGVNSNSTSKNNANSYTINFNFDPTIFNISNNVKLFVPNTTTTRLEINNPTDLFSTQNSINSTNYSGGQ